MTAMAAAATLTTTGETVRPGSTILAYESAKHEAAIFILEEPLPCRCGSDLNEPNFALEEHLPIKTISDLLQYADNVAGSIASAICYLAWPILTPSPTPARPVDSLSWATQVHAGTSVTASEQKSRVFRRVQVTLHAREMGRALQLVNIGRDIAKDALIGRLYIPLSTFSSAKHLLDVVLLHNPSSRAGADERNDQVPDYSRYSLPFMDLADELRSRSQHAMADLPRTARGGTRAMVASYFEIAEEIRRRRGAVDEGGVKVHKWRRLLAASRAIWSGMP